MDNNIILIDGGMGQELIHRSKVKPDGLWSARVMLDEYDLVVNLHKDFINAGARGQNLGHGLTKTTIFWCVNVPAFFDLYL